MDHQSWQTLPGGEKVLLSVRRAVRTGGGAFSELKAHSQGGASQFNGEASQPLAPALLWLQSLSPGPWLQVSPWLMSSGKVLPGDHGNKYLVTTSKSGHCWVMSRGCSENPVQSPVALGSSLDVFLLILHFPFRSLC